MVTYLDLFAGMGGLRLGLSQAAESMDIASVCVLTSEIKKHAVEVYKANYAADVQGDIRDLVAKDVPDCDVLLAGFPCQSFSSAGKRLGFEDTRGTLFFEVARILTVKKPKFFILENVEHLVIHDRPANSKTPIGRTLATILRVLEGIGYHVTWKVLQSADFGLAQGRRRVYIVGSLASPISLDFETQDAVSFGSIQECGLPVSKTVFTEKLTDYLRKMGKDWTYLYGKSVQDKRAGSNNIHSWDLGLRGVLSDTECEILQTIAACRRHKANYAYVTLNQKNKDGLGLTVDEITCNLVKVDINSSLKRLQDLKYIKCVEIQGKDTYDLFGGKLSHEFSKIMDPNQLCPTLVATDARKLGVVDGDGVRRLTQKECLRLQGFPDTFDFCGLPEDKVFDLLGNSVSVPVVKAISQRILTQFLT